MIEEYPPYLRSITLERLSPATEYSLQVVAVYLNKFRRPSRRVEFISPTDNESRRFKENTYRPIHRYPDEEPRELRYGLAQVRGEELTLVAIALIFWIATICLFFNNWGKIRMLEPYQPAYRDTAGATATFAHHHPASMHNLSGASILPATVVASSSPIAAMAPSGVVALAASSAASMPASSYASVEQPISSSGTEPTNQRQHNMHQSLEAGSSGVGSRKSSRNLALLVGRRRYETIADDSPVRRTYAELNYLFQSKAQALAKAQIWSRQQSSLHGGSISSTAAGAPPTFNCQTGGTAAAGGSRRISLLLRQRQMSQCPGSSPQQVQSPASPLLQCSLDTGSLERLRDQIRASRSPAAVHNVLARNSIERHQRRFGSTSTAESRCGSLEKPDDGEVAAILTGGEHPARQEFHQESANKLRRLLFMSRSHQHHHIATSTSSCTTLIGQPLAPTQQVSESVGFSTNNDYVAGRAQSDTPEAAGSTLRSRINSQSVDAPSGGEFSPPLTASLQESQQRLHQKSTRGSTSDASSVQVSQAGALRSSLCSLHAGSRAAPWALRRALTPSGREELGGRPAAAASGLAAADRSRRRVEHHILIEPPSPPNQHESFALQLETKTKPTRNTKNSDRPSIYFEEAPPQPQSNLSPQTFEDIVLDCCDHERVGARAVHEDAFVKLARYQADLQQRHRQLIGGQKYHVNLSDSHQSTTDQEPCEYEHEDRLALRPRMSSVFVASPFSNDHRGSFAMLRALSQKKSKSAEDVAHLSSLVLQIWSRNRNPLLQSVSQHQLDGNHHRTKQKSSLTVSHI